MSILEIAQRRGPLRIMMTQLEGRSLRSIALRGEAFRLFRGHFRCLDALELMFRALMYVGLDLCAELG